MMPIFIHRMKRRMRRMWRIRRMRRVRKMRKMRRWKMKNNSYLFDPKYTSMDDIGS